MLVLYETALGFCLFKLTDSAKLESADLWEEFESPEKANKLYVCIRTSCFVGSELTFFSFVFGKVEASRFASIYVHCDGRRRNHRDSGRKNREGPKKILVRRNLGEREGQAISLGRGKQVGCVSMLKPPKTTFV